MSGLSNLNQQFAIKNHLDFIKGQDGLIYAEVKNDSGSARIFLHGAHISSYVPVGQEPVIFLSPDSLYEPGKAIRGGIPISWPWFADHPSDKSKPAHGFARTSLWEVRGSRQISSGGTEITLGLRDSDNTHSLWDHRFDLEIAVKIGRELEAELTMTNTGDDEFTVTSAFHSYYHVGDIGSVELYGLEDTDYIDKVSNYVTKRQDGPVTITDETDRIYLDTKNSCVIEDRALNRKILVRKTGSNSTVVWNPWSEKARAMKDLGDEDYRRFVCVETTNAAADMITIAPGDKHILGLRISVENI